MADAMSIWVPFLSAMGGGLITIAAQYFADNRRVKFEREARNETRREKLLLRQLEFQHTNLIELQDAIQMKGRATGKIHHEDKMAAKAGGSWRKNQVSKEANDLEFEATAQILKLSQRVRNDDIRSQALLFNGICVDATMTKSEQQADDEFIKVISQLKLMQDAIGTELRTLDEQIIQSLG